MNILPTVLAFIILFSLLSHSFIENTQVVKSICVAKKGYMKAQRLSRKQLIESSFITLPEKKQPKDKPSIAKENISSEEVDTSREGNRPQEYIGATLNLAPLFQKEKVSLFYEKLCLELFTRCYENVASEKASQEALAAIFSSIIKDGKAALEKAMKDQKPFTMDLKDLSLKDATLASLYYDLLRGTRIYDISSQKGYPPLETLFSIDLESKKKPLHFGKLSPMMLSLIFGDKNTSKILEQELRNSTAQHRATTLKKEELDTLLKGSIGANQLQEIFNWMDFQADSKSKNSICIAIDPYTQIKEERLL